MRTYQPEYSFDQIKAEVIARGGELVRGEGITASDYRVASGRLKMNAVAPSGCPFEWMLQGSRSPWGKIQNATPLTGEAHGIYMVSTASHGGLWLSDKWKAKLPKWYKPFTGNRRWAEEDCDAAIVLQSFGLLTLFHEVTTLRVTVDDIEKGHLSRTLHYGAPYFGGAISEAYRRTFKYDSDLAVALPSDDGWRRKGTMYKPPGFAYADLSEEAVAFQRACDNGEAVKPTVLSFVPEIYVPLNIRK